MCIYYIYTSRGIAQGFRVKGYHQSDPCTRDFSVQAFGFLFFRGLFYPGLLAATLDA